MLIARTTLPMTMTLISCEECDEPGCPGVIVCPQCGVGEHGIAAETHIVDHGYCHECLLDWQYGEDRCG